MTKSMTNGSASPSLAVQASGSGSRSASLDKKRVSYSDSDKAGSGSLAKLSHSRTVSGSSVERGASGTRRTSTGQIMDASLVSASVVGTVAPPPKERLPPSPPLTPVASISSLRKTAATGGDGRTKRDSDITSKSGKAREAPVRVAADRSGTTADGDDGEVDVDVDTEADGALSTWSFRPDGDTSRETREGATNDETDGHTLAQPSSIVAIPQSSSYDNPPKEPVLPREDQHPLSGSDVDLPRSHPNLFPTTASASDMAPGHEVSTPLPPRLHPPHNAPSPQPWDLVEPPPDNNYAQMEEMMRRARKESNKSAPGNTANVVVKDGKKYRIPHSSYYFGPPSDTSAFGTEPIGHLGVHHPREIVRIERDYSGGELAQFSPAYPLELEGRITPTQFLETVNAINESLIEAHSLRWSFFDNSLAVLTLYISRLFIPSHYDRKMRRLKELIEEQNKQHYNPVGLNILWPKDVAFMFLEIEYY